MNREIKFRGKHKNPYGDKWVHGYYSMKDGRHVIIMPHADDYIKSLNERKPILPISVEHTIDVNTLGQYTGLKDKNGVEIYEGDIVKRHNEIGYIEYDHFNCNCCDGVYGWGINPYNYYIDLRNYKELEVIGNIFENSELLEKRCKDE